MDSTNGAPRDLPELAESPRGNRHRTDLRDLDALAASIDRDGLLQPPTITTGGNPDLKPPMSAV